MNCSSCAEVEGIDHRLPFGGREQGLADITPGVGGQQEQHHPDEHDLAEGALQEVGDDHRDLTTEEHEEQRGREHHRHEDRKRRKHPDTDGHLGRKPAERDEETSRHRGEDPVVDDPGQKGDQAGEDPESPRVSKLEELRHGEGPGLPEPVDDPARQRDEDHRRVFHEPPPDAGEPDVVVLLPEPDQRDHAELSHSITDRDQIAPGATIGGEETRDRPGISVGGDRRHQKQGEEGGENRPVERGEVHDQILLSTRTTDGRHGEEGSSSPTDSAMPRVQFSTSSRIRPSPVPSARAASMARRDSTARGEPSPPGAVNRSRR